MKTRNLETGRFIVAQDIETRFWEKIYNKFDDECWNWFGAITDKGYGNIDVNGKMVGAHRVSWEIHFGKIPDGMHVLHSCDNKRCVNPRHLFLGTNLDNMRDKVLKGRQPNGRMIWQAKLSDSDIPKIRELYSTGEYSHRKLAEMFGLSSHSSIRKIINGTAWKHV
jgi:hypothetical protein